MKLTDKIVAALPVPPKGNKRVPDAEVRGFNAQVTAAGLRAFVLRYRAGGRERQITIGAFPTWNTAAARNEAKRLRRLVDQGVDPLDLETRARDEAITVAGFWSTVYEPLHVGTLRPKWARDVRSMMKHDILPRLGDRAVKDVDHADIAALHRAISKRAPTRANRVRAVVSKLMSFAELPHITGNGDRVPALRSRGSNPVRGVRLNREERRQRFLSPAELARLAAVLADHPERTSVALIRFLLLTGARFSEAATATWDQVDLAAGAWIKPAASTKQGKPHRVPLSAPAMALLAELPRAGPYLFPGRGGAPITTVKTLWAVVTRKAELPGLRVHDLRHSYASILAGAGLSLPMIGALLGHANPQTTARYAHLADDPLRQATERAGAVIAGQPLAEIVPIGGRRRG